MKRAKPVAVNKALPIVDWCFVTNGGKLVTCERCGTFMVICLPLRTSHLAKALNEFTDEHKHCQEKDT